MGRSDRGLCSRGEETRLGVTTAFAVLVALTLGFAGATKIAHPDVFALAVGNYHLLPKQVLTPVAYLVPPLEIVTALALLWPAYRATGWILAGGLFTTFVLAVGSALARGLDVSCGCFGQAMTVSWLHLLGNALAVVLCFWQARRLLAGNDGETHLLPNLHPSGEDLDSRDTSGLQR